jgi:ELWxxDGT repeat protein
MKEQLRTTPCLATHRMYKGLYIFLLMIYGAAHSQPTVLSVIPNESKNFVYVNGSLYYSVADNLYKGNSISTPTLVKATGENIIRIYDITLGNNFFFVTQGGSGQRLWRTDGTAVNTVQVTTATEIIPLLIYNSQLFLRINATTTGMELYKMDGTYNVTLLRDINPGAPNGYIGFAGSLITHNGLLYFIANAGSGEDIWKSDGTTAGTVMSADIDDTAVYNPSAFSGLTSYNNALYFTRNHEDPEWGDRIAELWKSDGTTEGTAILVTYGGGNFWNYIAYFTVFKGKLYFFHGIGDPPHLWLSVTDGTAAGTQHLDLVTIDGDLKDLKNAEQYLLYYADTQGFLLPLQKFDGTTSSDVHEFYEGDVGLQREDVALTYTEGRAFFVAYEEAYRYPEADRQLFQADLASGTTRTVTEIYNGISFHGSGNITAADGSIFFTREDSGQTSLWYYDPDAPPSTCEGTGNILQEIWTNVTGTDVRTFDFSTPPTGPSRSFNSFETTQYYANNYASRMRGTICVPQSGYYTFWISSDDYSELYLSTNAFDENKRLIAWVYGHTPFRNYDKYPSQKSEEIYLESGRKYYIEARHKEGNGNDFISVGWQLPDGTMERPIAGTRLTPFMSDEPEPCIGTGTVVREIWRNIPGTSISSIPVNSPPTNTVTLTSLSTQNYYANDYGSRIRGYICPPATGTYVFYISGDDTAELWISSDDDPTNKWQLASVPAATRVNQYNKYMSQFGDTYFVQGQRYYFEVLHKEANGADHVEVGWELPDGTSEFPVPGNRLIPFEDPSTTAAMFAASDVTSFEEEGKVSISPNPVASGNQVFINLPGATDQEVLVDIKSITGVSVQSETLSSNGEGVIIDLKPSIAAGMYLIRVSNNKKRWATKLQVK